MIGRLLEEFGGEYYILLLEGLVCNYDGYEFDFVFI